MTDAEPSKEERILRAVKMALTNVIKDTATPAGMRHPLSDGTIQDLRQCLALISARERELAESAGRPQARRPHYVDEPAPQKEVVVKFQKTTKDKPKGN
ncbi:MAG: segregation and condensation protein A [Gammaproteobacteria bacterium]|nr:segregation and condensation protein A [Gammaproteobacteria bacterium]